MESVASGKVFCASYIFTLEQNMEGMFQQTAGNNELPCIYLQKNHKAKTSIQTYRQTSNIFRILSK